MLKNPQSGRVLVICSGKSCIKRGAHEVAAAMTAALEHDRTTLPVLRHDCFDLCKRACILMVQEPGGDQRYFARVHPKEAAKLARHLAAEVDADTIVNTIVSS